MVRKRMTKGINNVSHGPPPPTCAVIGPEGGGGGGVIGRRDLNVEARGSSFHVQEAFKNLW